MDDPGRPTPDALTYEAAMTELDTIIAELERGDVDVDGVGARLTRGAAIVEDLLARIRRAEDDVARLAPRLEALARRDPPAPAP